MEIEEGAALQRDQARGQQAPHHRARLLRARRRLDRAGLDARDDQRQLRGRRAAHRHVPGRRRLLEHRELHRHRADPAGEPLRQRPVARAAGADLRAPAARQHPLLRAVLPRLGLVDVASSSTTSSSSSPTSRGARSAARSRSATRSSSRGSASASPTTVQHDTRRHAATSNTFFGTTSGFVSVFQRLPLANLFNAGRTSRSAPRSPTTRATTASSRRAASTSRPRPSSPAQRARQRDRVPPPPAHRPLLLPALRPGRAAGLGLHPQAEHRGRRRHEPARAGRADLRALLPRRHPRRPRLRLRTLGPRLPLNASLDVNAPPIPNGANIGGNLLYYSNLEFEFPIIDKVGIRGVVFIDAGNAWNLEEQFCKTTPAPAVLRAREPVLRRRTASRPAHVVGLRHPLVLAARPAALRVGLPAQHAHRTKSRASSSSRSATSSEKPAGRRAARNARATS